MSEPRSRPDPSDPRHDLPDPGHRLPDPGFSLPDLGHVDLDGTTVATRILEPVGRPARADVVLCHGTPWSSLVWGPVAHRLVDDGYRVLLWDMPGYGRSAAPADVPVGLDHQMARFAALLRHWRLDGLPHVVAHDIGGAVALGAHLLHDAGFASLFLWDVVALEPWGSPFFRLVAEHEEVFAALPGPLHRALVREYVAGAARHRLSPEWVEALTEPWTDAGLPAFYRQTAQLSPAHTRPVVSRLAELRCRAGIGWGAQDPWLPVDQAARLQRALPGDPPVTVLDDVGHLAPVEAPAAVHHALADWLAAG